MQYPNQPAPGSTYTGQPQVVVVQQNQQRPPDNFVFSLIVCLFCDVFCLGLAALICSVQSRSAADGNNMEDARNKGIIARNLSIAAIVCTIVIVILVIILYFTVYVVLYQEAVKSLNNNSYP